MITADAATTEWLRRSDRARIAALVVFLGLTALLSAGREHAEILVFVTLGLWLATAGVAERLLRRRRNGDRLRTVLLAADIAWITATLHITGVAQRSGVAAYMFIVAIAAGALSRRVTTWLTAWAVVAYGVLLAAESAPYLQPNPLAQGSVFVLAPSTRIAAWVLGSAALAAFAYLMRTLVTLLARTEARHRLLFWASPRPMYVYDVDTLQFLAVNDATVREYGYAREELLAMTVADISVPEDGDPARAAAAAEVGPHKHAGTWRHHRRDGSLLDVEITSHPISADGRAARLVIVTDVTERTRLEARLRQTQRLEALGRLAGGVAHEFNNLLAAVLGHAELLSVALPAGAEGRDNAEEIMRAARRGADLTRHMLAFGRRQLLRPEVVDVSGVVRDMERLLRPLLAADVRVTLALPDASWARVDRSQLELVIMNLAMNARDAMPRGGSLTMDTSLVDLGIADRERHPNVALSLGRYVRLSVSDTGAGISPEVRERIFEPFFTTKPVGKGTGLGLSTVYGIIKQSEGYVWVYSELGHGTTMHVYLPSVPAPADAITDGASRDAGGVAPAPNGRAHGAPAVARDHNPAGPERAHVTEVEVASSAPTVLVVDDEGAVRSTAVRVLRDAGYRILDAGSEAAALALVADVTVDVVLTDVIMPGIGGVALAEHIQLQQPAARVIYMSGYPQSHLVSSGRLRGSYAFVAKPFTAQELRDVVAEAASAATGRTSPATSRRREPGYAGSRASVPRSKSAP
jgi:two-component system, cell cycle sensor histidine kinase and response regulator CckA